MPYLHVRMPKRYLCYKAGWYPIPQEHPRCNLIWSWTSLTPLYSSLPQSLPGSSQSCLLPLAVVRSCILWTLAHCSHLPTRFSASLSWSFFWSASMLQIYRRGLSFSRLSSSCTSVSPTSLVPPSIHFQRSLEWRISAWREILLLIAHISFLGL